MRASAVLLCLAALVVAGCGEKTEKERYVDAYQPLHNRLISINRQLSGTLESVERDSDQVLERRFDTQIAQLEEVDREISDLDTPVELRDESSGLTQRIGETVGTLRDISTAVREHENDKAASSTVELATKAQDVSSAQNSLARATGAKISD